MGEIFTFDNILAILGLFTGGGIGVFFTLRYQKKKAKAEAAQAEAEAQQKAAEAKAAEIEMAQKVQDTYQEMLEDKQKEVADNQRLIAELREDRDHYKQGYVEMRDALDKLGKEFRDFRTQTEEEREKMKRDIARNGRQVEALRPFLCGLLGCKNRQPVTISADGEVKQQKTNKKKDIEPLAMTDL